MTAARLSGLGRSSKSKLVRSMTGHGLKPKKEKKKKLWYASRDSSPPRRERPTDRHSRPQRVCAPAVDSTRKNIKT